MYEKFTKQSLPDRKYRELLGTAIVVFNANNAFIIENFLRLNVTESWYKLIDMESGYLKNTVKETIVEHSGKDIVDCFNNLVDMRNRIVHSYQVTNDHDEQVLYTKDKQTQNQFEITTSYLMNFINKNDELSNKLHEFRGF